MLFVVASWRDATRARRRRRKGGEGIGRGLDGLEVICFACLFQLCMVLIKVADISNEARPMDVAEPWLDCLLQEFYEQSDVEKLLGLPVTPFMDRDKVSRPSSQCSFIGFVLLPLFEAVGRLFPQLEVGYIIDPDDPFVRDGNPLKKM